MIWKRPILLLIVATLAGLGSVAVRAESPSVIALPEVARGRVVATVAAPVPILTLEDGRRVRLALLADPATGRAATASGLTVALAALTDGEEVVLRWPERRWDRHGRLIAHVARRRDGLWVQGSLVADGLAVVMPVDGETALAGPLLRAEAAARRAGRGLWGDPRFAVRRAATVRSEEGALRLVEGRVAAVAEVRGTVYLNFGADWRDDFTGRMSGAQARACAAQGVDPLAMEGRRLRLRGWMRRANGPLSEITVCDQMEILDD